ncbi:MAG: Xaa-Pro peptidase family protein [Chloroflexi bacterium]|nr:Xaa-Pro peptidase family protein [Chloroflexota bacterium]
MPIRMDRVRRAQELMAQNNIDALMLLNHDEYIYFIGEDRSQPRAIVPREGEPAIIVFREELQEARQNIGAKDIRTFSGLAEQMKTVVTLLKEFGAENGRVGVEMGFGTPLFLVERFQRANPKVHIVDSEPVIGPLRMIKTAEEMALLGKAARIAEVGMKAAIDAIREGVTENEVAAEAEYAMRKAGGHGVAVPTFVNSGYRSGWLHGSSTDKRILPGELILLDVVPVHAGYCGNLARTVVLGEPEESQLNLFAIYQAAQQAALDAIKPGVKNIELDRAAERVVTQSGYGKHYVRGISHGIGLMFEETPAPTISPAHAQVELQAGMVITAGHSVLSVPGIGGVRLEDMVVVTEEGWEPLTEFPKQLQI